VSPPARSAGQPDELTSPNPLGPPYYRYLRA
jgi:hypothetical protein